MEPEDLIAYREALLRFRAAVETAWESVNHLAGVVDYAERLAVGVCPHAPGEFEGTEGSA